MYDREVRNGLRFREAFVAYACKAVVCGHEEVISADVAGGVEWWAFGSNGSGQGVPFQLFVVAQVPPLLESSLVDGQLYLLPCSTRKHRLRFGTEEALSVPVVECDVAH